MIGAGKTTNQGLARPPQSASFPNDFQLSNDFPLFGQQALKKSVNNENFITSRRAFSNLFPTDTESTGQGTVEFWTLATANRSNNVFFWDIQEVATEIAILARAGSVAQGPGFSARCRFGATTVETPIGRYPANTWVHVAVTLHDNRFLTLWINGSRIGTVGNGTDTLVTSGGNWWRLSVAAQALTTGMASYVREYRVSRVPRYNRNNTTYTVPTGPFVNDEYTHMLFHMDGTDIQGNEIFDDVSNSSDWKLSLFDYDKSFDVASQELEPQGIFFRPEGTSAYIIGSQSDRVNQYNLSTPWDIGTASFFGSSAVLTQDGAPFDLFFKPDGTKLYTAGNGTDRIYQYSLTTAWNATTVTYDNVSFLISGQDLTPQGLYIKPDGTQFYMVGSSTGRVYQYSMSTAWNLSTAAYANKSFTVTSQETVPRQISFKPDGTKFFLVGSTSDNVVEYVLSTPWDISTAVYTGTSLFVRDQDGTPTGIFVNDHGSNFYLVGASGDRIYQYSAYYPKRIKQSAAIGSDFATTWQISVPTATEIGDLLLSFGAARDDRFVTPPTGWTELADVKNGTISAAHVFWRRATEADLGGTTYNYTPESGGGYTNVCVVIKGGDNPTISTAVTPSSNTVSTAFNATGTTDNVYFSFVGARNTSAVTVSSIPPGHTQVAFRKDPGSFAAVSRLISNATFHNPGNWVFSSSETSQAVGWTVRC